MFPPPKAAVAPPPEPVGGPVKVWVGKLPVTVSEDFLEKLLGVAGPVKEWKRVADPTQKGLLKPLNAELMW